MKLSRALQGVTVRARRGSADPEIADVVVDSRQARAGSLFVALSGTREDGGRYALDAVKRGAAAVISAAEVDLPADGPAVVLVDDAVAAAAATSANVCGRPADALTLVGVTGTNGKTTTTHMIAAILRAAGRPTGLVGTLGVYPDAAGKPIPGRHTTPDAPSLHRAFAAARDAGARNVVMEVSSHALAQRRVEGCAFAVAAFTNLTPDHLDYHGDMEAYYQAKRALFALADVAVVLVDHEAGRRLLGDIEGPGLTVSAEGDAEVTVSTLVRGPGKTRVRLTHGSDAVECELPFVGRHNLENAAVAAGAAAALGVPLATIASGLERCPQVPGRLERIPRPELSPGGRALGYVDYAHTPDALSRVLSTLREGRTPGRRIITVFGCGGERDRTKRPLMARAVAELSDVAILTSDNPRHEDPATILADAEAGFAGHAALGAGPRGWITVPSRERAIQGAAALAEVGDVVLLAGKGHETGQLVGEVTLPFRDAAWLAPALRGPKGGLTLGDLAAATGGELEGDPRLSLAGVCTDSRVVRPGEVFVALRGPSFDGHDYCGPATRQGAAALVAEHSARARVRADVAPGTPILWVDDALYALGEIGAYHRRRFPVAVVGVTGSNGKTTTKEMLGEVLQARSPTLRTRGNLNNLIGVPLTLLKLDELHRFVVVEMGMNRPGEIARYAELASPQVGVILNAQSAHLEGLGSVEAVARAKAELWERLQLFGTMVYPAEDPLLVSVADDIARRRGDLQRLTFGTSADADVRLLSHRTAAGGGTDLVLLVRGEEQRAWISHLGDHNALNATAAVAAGVAMGLSPAEAVHGLRNARTVPHRLTPVAAGEVVVLDDCYNANPGSMSAALRTAAQAAGEGHVIAVLGDMLELGEASVSAHRDLGVAAARAGVRALVGFGPRAKDIVAGAAEAGLTGVHLTDPTQVVYWLRPRLRWGDWVLVKGSRGMRMERIVDALVTDLGGVPPKPAEH